MERKEERVVDERRPKGVLVWGLRPVLGENTRPARTWNRFSRNNRVTPSISDEASVVPGLSFSSHVGLLSFSFPTCERRKDDLRTHAHTHDQRPKD